MVRSRSANLSRFYQAHEKYSLRNKRTLASSSNILLQDLNHFERISVNNRGLFSVDNLAAASAPSKRRTTTTMNRQPKKRRVEKGTDQRAEKETDKGKEKEVPNDGTGDMLEKEAGRADEGRVEDGTSKDKRRVDDQHTDQRNLSQSKDQQTSFDQDNYDHHGYSDDYDHHGYSDDGNMPEQETGDRTQVPDEGIGDRVKKVRERIADKAKRVAGKRKEGKQKRIGDKVEKVPGKEKQKETEDQGLMEDSTVRLGDKTMTSDRTTMADEGRVDTDQRYPSRSDLAQENLFTSSYQDNFDNYGHSVDCDPTTDDTLQIKRTAKEGTEEEADKSKRGGEAEAGKSKRGGEEKAESSKKGGEEGAESSKKGLGEGAESSKKGLGEGTSDKSEKMPSQGEKMPSQGEEPHKKTDDDKRFWTAIEYTAEVIADAVNENMTTELNLTGSVLHDMFVVSRAMGKIDEVLRLLNSGNINMQIPCIHPRILNAAIVVALLKFVFEELLFHTDGMHVNLASERIRRILSDQFGYNAESLLPITQTHVADANAVLATTTLELHQNSLQFVNQPPVEKVASALPSMDAARKGKDITIN